METRRRRTQDCRAAPAKASVIDWEDKARTRMSESTSLLKKKAFNQKNVLYFLSRLVSARLFFAFLVGKFVMYISQVEHPSH